MSVFSAAVKVLQGLMEAACYNDVETSYESCTPRFTPEPISRSNCGFRLMTRSNGHLDKGFPTGV